MPHYSYKAKDEYGKTIRGTITAESEDALISALERLNLYFISASIVKVKDQITFERITRKDLIPFTIHLATTISAGVSILQSLHDLETHTRKIKFRKIIREIRTDIESGLGFSEALERHPKAFSQLYVSIVKAGESTGNLDQVLNDLIRFLEWQEELAANVKQATIYPAFIFTAVTLLVVLLMTFVFPRFAIIFERTNVPLPIPTRIVMAVSHFFSNYWYILLLAVIGIIIFQRLLVRNSQGRLAFDKLKLGLPIFGNLLRKIALSRFSHYLSLLFKAGVEISYSLTVLENVVGNAVIAKVVRTTRERVRAGELISESLEKSKEFPPLVIRMVYVGETTGTMEMTLEKVSQYYDREVPASIKKVFAVFEPLTVIFLAVVVLGMALSMFLPLYQMMSLVGR